MSRFLRFLAERHLEGQDNQLKESVIAVEVFGRKPDHDPLQDSIVRTEAGRLRGRLAEYYVGEGKDDAVIIELPKGGYIPAFRFREQASPPAPPPKSYGGECGWGPRLESFCYRQPESAGCRGRNDSGETRSGKPDFRR